MGRTHLQPADLFDLQFLRTAQFSSDGRHVAHGMSRTDGAERFEVWITECGTGNRWRLNWCGNAAGPSWSPDGRTVAFVADGRLRLCELATLNFSEPLSPENGRVCGSPCWSPDGTRIAISLMESRTVGGARRVEKSIFRADSLGFVDDFRQSIYEVHVADRRLRCLTDSDLSFCSQPEWSPCGRRVMFLACDDVIPFASYSQRLLTVAVEDRTIEQVLGDDWYIECARWLPDGERIAVSGGSNGSLTIPVALLWVVNRHGGKADLRTPGLTANIGLRLNHDMPSRELTSGNAFVVLDEHTVYATLQKGGRGEIWRIALDGDIAMQRVLDTEGSCILLDWNRESNSMLFATTDLRQPTELNHAALDGFAQTRLTSLNTDVLTQWPEMRVEQFSFASEGGLQIDAWFMAAADRELPLPTVLFIHAGPFIATGHAFRYDFHLLASHGFGVVFANFRGSAGYGESFAQAIMGDWGARGFPDHLAAVDAAVERGYADPSRLGIWGHSHGGFATCWVVGHTNRFKAAVAEASVTDFASLYYTTDAPGVFARDLGGRPHEIPEVYRSRSPLVYAHRCATPILLIHGEDDLRSPIAQAEAFHRAVKDAGCVSEILRIPGCSHSGDSIGPLSARVAQNEALLGWFKRFL